MSSPDNPSEKDAVAAEPSATEPSHDNASAPAALGKKKRKKKAPQPVAHEPLLAPESKPGVDTAPTRANNRWLAIPLSLLSLTVAVWRLSRLSACRSTEASISASDHRVALEPRRASPADAYRCGVECEQSCGGGDAAMMASCRRLCADECPVDATTPTPTTGIPECDAYLSSWAQCRPADKKEILKMAWHIGASLSVPANRAQVVEVCSKSAEVMGKVCGNTGLPRVTVNPSAATSASAAPSSTPVASASAGARRH